MAKHVNIDALDRANIFATQLRALLSVTTGEPGDGFRMLSDELQNDFLWACADIASDLKDAIGQIGVNHE